MIFTKRFNKFIKSEQFKMIGCIFLVLLASIMIKLSMPDTFEHLNPIQFVLKFKEAELSDFKITDFDFKISVGGSDIPAEQIHDKSLDADTNNRISEVKFTVEAPKEDFDLKITPKEGTSKISSFKIGTDVYAPNPNSNSYIIPITANNVALPIIMNVS